MEGTVIQRKKYIFPIEEVKKLIKEHSPIEEEIEWLVITTYGNSTVLMVVTKETEKTTNRY